MKKLITILFLFGLSLNSFGQIDIIKRKVTLDSISARNDSIYVRSPMTGEYIRSDTLEATTYIGLGVPTFPISSDSVNVDTIGGATHISLQSHLNNTGSAGQISGGEITDGGSQTFDVAAGTGIIRSADSHVAPTFSFDWVASNGNAIVDGEIKYVFVDYNFGSPQVNIKSSFVNNLHTEFYLGNVVREGLVLHFFSNPDAVINYDSHNSERLRHDGFARKTGLILGETGNRKITITSGETYYKNNEISISAFNSNTGGVFDTYIDDTQDAASQTQWDSTNYNNGGSKTALTNNRYGVLWFYEENDGNVVYLYGTSNSASIAGAEAESVPSVVPKRITAGGFLIGRGIFQKGAGDFSVIETVFETMFTSTTPVNHNDFANINGTEPFNHLGDPELVNVQKLENGSATQLIIGDGAGSFDWSTGLNYFGDSLVIGGNIHADTAKVNRIGIGISNPEYTLDVIGRSRIQSDLIIGSATPTTWTSYNGAFDGGSNAIVYGASGDLHLVSNAKGLGSWTYYDDGKAINQFFFNGGTTIRTAISGTAGAGINWLTKFVVVNSGNVGLDIVNPLALLHLDRGNGIVNGLNFGSTLGNGFSSSGTDVVSGWAGNKEIFRLVENVTEQFIINPQGDLTGTAAAPSLALGNGDAGWWEVTDNNIGLTLGGNDMLTYTSAGILLEWTVAYKSKNSVGNPQNLIKLDGSNNIQIGNGTGLEETKIYAGSIEAMRLTEDTVYVDSVLKVGELISGNAEINGLLDLNDSFNNSFIGFQSGNTTLTTATQNVALGEDTGHGLTTGAGNVFLGFQAGSQLTSGDNNVFIGNTAGGNNITGTDNVFIGNLSGENETGSNKLYIDNTNTTTPLIYGDFVTNTLTINDTLVVTGVIKGVMNIAKAEILYTNTSQTAIVTLPTNAVVWDIAVETITIFDDSGVDLLDIGITSSSARYVVSTTLLTNTGFKLGNKGDFTINNNPDKMTGQTNITFQYSPDGTPSQGQAFIYIHYSIP